MRRKVGLELDGLKDAQPSMSILRSRGQLDSRSISTPGIVWRRQNLLHDPVAREAAFDLILRRNVAIDFEYEAKGDRRRFVKALGPGGILILGGAERVFVLGKLAWS